MSANDLISIVVFAALSGSSFWSYHQLHRKNNVGLIPAASLSRTAAERFVGPFAFMYLVHGLLVAAAVLAYLALRTPVVPSLIVLIAYVLFWLRRRMLVRAIDKAAQ